MVIIETAPFSGTIIKPHVEGKFFFIGEEKIYLRGVTYGAFRPNEDGNEFYNLSVIENDFALMAANGITTIRIPHTTPPRSLLDIAGRYDLKVMVGLSAEQYIGFLIDKEDAPDIEKVIRSKVQTCVDHPALLCYAIGNEIPASIVRWLGRRRVERYLEEIYWLVKEEDPDGLITYVNYPSTEYLQLPFLDIVCFNVYLEDEDQLKAYLPRLQNIAGDRPLIISELGLDSIRNTAEKQAQVLDWQIRAAFSAGCAGIFIFSWTDEWHRNGNDVDDWAFGIMDQYRQPKPALNAVRDAFTEVPLPSDFPWPCVSVVVCSHNGASTIRECCAGLLKLKYPNFEVIVVDDGSRDQTAAIARDCGFQVISTTHAGLSNARNIGLAAAKGDIVAYIDDDAYPDEHWLHYIVSTFLNTQYAGVGGPNLTPPDDGLIADCIARSPGNPTHVLLTDEEAEHIPGCNMAFKKVALEEIGGFDSQFWTAGDDVDVCWHLRQRGYSLGFSHAAIVWHHRRNSVRTYWKQQRGYGRAEAMLEKKWPEKFNPVGHQEWRGCIYSAGSKGTFPFLQRRIYHGIWGTAPFQSIYESGSGIFLSLFLTPEWILLIPVLLVFTALGALWKPLLLTIIPLVLSIGLSLFQAVVMAYHASFPSRPRSLRKKQIIKWGMITLLHLVQPLARLQGRLPSGLAPWRRYRKPKLILPSPQINKFWSEDWQASDKRLKSIEAGMRAQKMVVLRGGDYDTWDLEVRGGLFGSIRICMAVEDHGSGNQLIRFRTWPKFSRLIYPITFLLFSLAVLSTINQAWAVSIVFWIFTFGLLINTSIDCAAASTSFLLVLEQSGYEKEHKS